MRLTRITLAAAAVATTGWALAGILEGCATGGIEIVEPEGGGSDGTIHPTGDASCTGTQTSGNGSCTSTASDPKNCGSCGNACADGSVCSLSQCALTCAGGTTKCGASCVNVI